MYAPGNPIRIVLRALGDHGAWTLLLMPIYYVNKVEMCTLTMTCVRLHAYMLTGWREGGE